MSRGTKKGGWGGAGVAPSEKTGGSNPGGNIDIFIYFDILMYHVYISCK